VCQRFRDAGNSILEREFRSLKDCVGRLLADLEKEENALLTISSPNKLMLLRCRGTLSGIRYQINLLRDVGSRYLSLGDEQENILYSSVFAANIIDEVHSVLRIVKRGPLRAGWI
jgi:hypothetical protein